MSEPLSAKDRAKAEAIARLRRDPAAWARYQAALQVQAQRDQEAKEQQAIDAQRRGQNNALIGGIVAPIASVGGLYAANQLLSPSTTAEAGTKLSGLLGGSSSAPAATSAVPAVASGTGQASALSTPQVVGAERIGSTGAAGAAPASGWQLSNIGGAGNFVLPAAGALGAIDLASRGDVSKGRGALQGAASGAALGSYFGPVGALAGGVIGGVGGLAKGWLDDPKTEVEDKRVGKLQDRGVTGFEETFRATADPHAWYRQDLAPNFVGTAPEGTWTNNRFAMSRNEADLRPEDVWGYAAFGEKFGNDWFQKFTADQRRAIAQAALNRGAVDEHHGTIDVNWSRDLENDIANITGSSPSRPVNSKRPLPLPPLQQGRR